ncbi:ABC transporter ATP-binding protein [Flavobacteriales bacterium]|nr:ABC transporter ATP-binding protein [Flavobacteriales bacterium]|tara:strand:- start:570 stop:2291 length:1722 start_codon:yes stop_codon:yes gene_type:complete
MNKNKVTFAKAFKTIIWPRKKLLFIGIFLIIISKAAGLVTPIMMKPFVNNALGKDMDLTLQIVSIVIVSILINSLTSYLLTRFIGVEAQHLIAELRTKVQKKVLTLPINYFDNNKSGALVSRIMSDVEGVRNLVGTGFVQLIGGILASVAAFAYLITISFKLTIFVLLPMALFAVIALKAFSYIRPIFRERGKKSAEVSGRLTESLNGIRVIKGFGAEDQELHVFKNGVDEIFQLVKKSMTAQALMSSSGVLMIGLASAGVMGIGSFLGLNNGEFISYTAMIAFMVAPILQIGNIGSQFTEAFAGLDRTEEIMSLNPEEDQEIRTVELNSIDGEVIFNDVSFSYLEDSEVIKNISFKAKKGSVTALVGTSGSGKSTIAGLAASFLNPNSGNITIDGVDLSKVKLSSYRKKLGVVLQDDFLFEGSIKDNILFSKPNASKKQLDDAVIAANVNEFTDRFEDGIDTLIGERGVKLSGGQRQRITIARAIIADPRILILDEATSNLDNESESLIQESLKKLMKGRTTFVIAHRLSTIRQADQILVIENGKIAEKGTHDKLLSLEGRYYNLHKYQARI